jgi:hypothetical protein
MGLTPQMIDNYVGAKHSGNKVTSQPKFSYPNASPSPYKQLFNLPYRNGYTEQPSYFSLLV